MPIRFTCPQCHQRLSVPSEKSAQAVKCPRCRQVVRVPAEPGEGLPVPPPGPAPTPSVPGWPAAEAQGDAEQGADVPLGAAAPADGSPRSSMVSVPRYVVYAQGFLLGIVALVFFAFGMIVGGGARSESAPSPSQPCTVSGTVLYEDGTRQALPDESSVAIILPLAVRPDQKAAVDGLRPTDPEPGDRHPSMAIIRSLGGDYARIDRRGRYRLRVTAPGRYYLLIVSHHARRQSDQQPEPHELAQIGRYFVPATSLLDSQRYAWKELRIREDLEFNCQF
jgi:hypothetical protein